MTQQLPWPFVKLDLYQQPRLHTHLILYYSFKNTCFKRRLCQRECCLSTYTLNAPVDLEFHQETQTIIFLVSLVGIAKT